MSGMFSLTGRAIVVTGGSGVLGSTLVRHLAESGAAVAVIGRNAAKLAALEREAADAGWTLRGFAADVLDAGAVEAARDAVLAAFGRVDALVNAAGGNRPGATVAPGAPLTSLKLDEYRQVLALNLEGTLIPCIAFAEALEKSHGSIVNFSSMAATQPLTRVLGYGNAKAGVDNLTRFLAVEFAGRVRVNAIAPGFFLAEQNRALLLRKDGGLTERGAKVIAKTPMGRFGEPREIVGCIQYLLSDAASFVTGAVIPVDGGFSAFSGV